LKVNEKVNMKALDLFCGAGGASMGLHRAGFEVVGVDISDQPDYPFEFIKADCRNLPIKDFRDFDLIWASPKCQAHSWASKRYRNEGRYYEEQIEWTRSLLEQLGKPYIIENVPLAPIRKDIVLCGTMFSLDVIRHRHFEIKGFRAEQPRHPNHDPNHLYHCVVGTGVPSELLKKVKKQAMYGMKYSYRLKDMQEAMGIDWMKLKELTQAIPPAYSEYLGKAFLMARA